MAGGKKTTAQLKIELEHKKLELEYEDRWRRAASRERLHRWPAILVAAALPLWVLAKVLEPFAGESTVLTWSFAGSVSLVGVPAGIVITFLFRKTQSQAAELVRLREAIAGWEREVLQKDARILDLSKFITDAGLDVPPVSDSRDR